VRLTWTHSTSPNVLRYSLVRSRLPLDLGATYSGHTTASPFDTPGLGKYYYRLRTVRAADSSAWSGEVTATACAFVTSSAVTVGSQPTAATAADLNEDDIQDVVLVTSGGSNLVTLLGQGAGGVGNGTFAAPVNVATGTTPACLALLDANGDGILDAIVGAQDANSVHLHLGQGAGGVGNGTFGAASLVATLTFMPTGLAVGDFDEDGVDDVVVAGGVTSLVMLRGLGVAGVPSGTFAAPVTIPRAASRVACWRTTGTATASPTSPSPAPCSGSSTGTAPAAAATARSRWARIIPPARRRTTSPPATSTWTASPTWRCATRAATA
jgi:hypothetical protein